MLVPHDVVSGIEDLLVARTEEIRAGSPGGSIHAEARPEVAARWRRAVAGFGTLGVELYEEELVDPVIDLSPPELVGIDGPAGPVYVVEVRRSWQVSGVDTHPTRDTLFLAVAPTPTGWGVVRDDPLRRLGLTSNRTLWEITEIEVVRDGGRVLVGAPSQRTRMREVAGLLAAAHGSLEQLDVPANYLVVVPSGAGQAKEFMQTPLDVSKFVAFVSFSVDRSDDWRAGPPRLVLQEGNLRRRSAGRQVFILAHELVHVDALQTAGPLTPLWVHEGYADWEANGRSATASGVLEIPEAHTFRSGSITDIVAAYNTSESLFARLATLGGPDGPARFFDEVGSVRSRPGTVAYHVDTALVALGLDRAVLEGRDSEG